ncbi:MAG: hypothetical protein WCN92_08385 [Eubacteriales bacterium]
MRKAYDEIYDYVSSLEIIDTHEHLPQREELRPLDTDILREYLSHYFSCDLVSAGLPLKELERCKDISLPIMKRWEVLEPFWNAARNTGYGVSLDIAVKELYGQEKICRSTIEELNNSFLSSLKPGHFEKALKEKAKIKISLVDGCKGCSVCDRNFYRPVFRLDMYRGFAGKSAITKAREESGIPIVCFDDWLDSTEKEMNRAIADGCVALKIGDAYSRSLYFSRVSKKDAEDEFNQFYSGAISDLSNNQTFQNYMLHYVMMLANKRNLTVQIHTGLQEGNGNLISNSDPTLLNNLFMEYSDVVFDIFHMGYPYEHMMSALAKNFANVNIDMCWANIISPTACVNALIEWIDSVPVNKISAFGGDYCFVDGVVGHSRMARRNISNALSIKVDNECFDVDRAKEIALMLFVKNPEKIFKLEGKI